MLPTPLALRLALRLARRLHAAWAGPIPDAPGEPDDAWEVFDGRLVAARQSQRRLRLAARTNLRLILPRLSADLTARLADLARAADDLRAVASPPPPSPSPAALLAELRQVEAEFGGLDVRWADGVVRAATEPVTLEGVDLGRFAVDFHWTRVGQHEGVRCFAIVALDPHPAAGSDDVVHPHVRDDELCPGDAAAPLHRAVAAGRLADAFLLVRSVLMTYNPASPHIPLAEWSGVPCGDCGRRVDRDDRFTCGGCDDDLCEGCAGSCRTCSETRCDACLTDCDNCRAACCRGCLEEVGGRAACPDCRRTCGRCGDRVAGDARTADGPLCQTCREGDQTDGDEGDDLAAPPVGGPATDGPP